MALVLPLLWLLSGCAVYDAAFHPHRLPTPKMDATAKAKAKAAEKARHKGLSLKAPEATDATATEAPATTGADGAAEPAAPPEKKKTMSYSELPEGTKLKYDKQGLVKKSRLDHALLNSHKLHHYDTRPLTPREASSENRKLRKKGHTKPGKGAPRKGKAEPLDPALDTRPDPGPPAEKNPKAPKPKPDPTQPAAPKPAKAKIEKVKVEKPSKPAKTKAAKSSQPDPTQPTAKTKGKKAPKAPKPDPTQPVLDGSQ